MVGALRHLPPCNDSKRTSSHRLWNRLAALIGLVTSGALAVACGSGSATTTARPAPSTTVAHVKLTISRFVVTPSTGLHNGQVVQVSVSGFPPGKVHLSECASPLNANPLGCGPQLAAQPFVVIEGNSGSSTFAVSNEATSSPLSAGPLIACSQCVLVAVGSDASPTGGFSISPIRFSP
jgi:hypothetical protein